MSPGYGTVGYANYQICTWTLISDNGKPFTLRFEDDFALEDGVDFLSVKILFLFCFVLFDATEADT